MLADPQLFGDRAAPAVLLVAGTGGCMMSWPDEFCTQLAAGGRCVIRYDQRDTGQSTVDAARAGRYGLRELAADAVAVLDGLGAARAHLVGASAGGAVAQLLALDHATRVASLTLLSTSPLAPGCTALALPGPSLRVRCELDDIEAPDWADPASVAEYLTEAARVRAGHERPFDRVGARALADRIVAHGTDLRVSLANHAALRYGDPWHDRLATLTAPTLVVHGTADPLVPLAHGTELAARIPGARLLTLPGAGHDLARADWPVAIPAILRHTGPP